MAILITKDGVFDVWSVPLLAVNQSDGKLSPNWEDKTWLVGHLRHLANKLETEDVVIGEIGIGIDRSSGVQY